MQHHNYLNINKYWGLFWSFLALQYPEGRICDSIRRLMFLANNPIGQNPTSYVRGGETVVFCGMWRAETLQSWSWQLCKGRRLKGVQGNGKLVVIEASPKNCEILSFEAQRRNLENVVVVNRALWSCSRKVTLAIKRETDANIVNESGAYSKKRNLDDSKFSMGEVTVDASPLDAIIEELNLRRVDHVHMTIGGSEVEAVKGMRKMLVELKPRVYCKSITYYKSNNCGLYENVNSVLSEVGMEVHSLNKKGNQLGKRFYAFFPYRNA